MLAISGGYAILFAGLRLFGASPFFMFATGGLFAAVGISQAWLFRGESPRAASLMVGGLYCAVACGIAASGSRYTGEIVAASVSALFWGPPAGYLAGGLVAGIFLVAEYGRRAMIQRREAAINQ